ncbi:MAG: zf-HC2 domain-containing protein [Methylococcales bacterium]|nr:zf-HC2 domain-containing protein [Methylococcales bacterium]
MKNCKDISGLVSESMDRPLTFRERWAVRLHFFMCRSCARFQRQIRFLRKMASRYQPGD